MTIEQENTLSREDVSLYMRRLEMRSEKTVGKSIEYLLAQAGGSSYVDDDLDKEYDAWRADNPLEASIWDEIRSSSRLPMNRHDWRSWKRTFDTNHELLQKLSFTFRKLDRHIKAIVVKRTYARVFMQGDLYDKMSYALSWNARKGLSLDQDACQALEQWLLQRADDKDVMQFNAWASQKVPLWHVMLDECNSEIIHSSWWGRRKEDYPKAICAHFDNIDLYLAEVKNAIRVHCLQQDGIRNWYLKTFRKDGVSEMSLRFETFV